MSWVPNASGRPGGRYLLAQEGHPDERNPLPEWHRKCYYLLFVWLA